MHSLSAEDSKPCCKVWSWRGLRFLNAIWGIGYSLASKFKNFVTALHNILQHWKSLELDAPLKSWAKNLQASGVDIYHCKIGRGKAHMGMVQPIRFKPLFWPANGRTPIMRCLLEHPNWFLVDCIHQYPLSLTKWLPIDAMPTWEHYLTDWMLWNKTCTYIS